MRSLFTNRSKKFFIPLAIIVLIGIGIQFTSPAISNPPVTGDFDGPDSIAMIFKRACYDCHSNETHLTWYDKIAPISWLVAADVKEARSRFNFSNWDSLSPVQQGAELWYMVNMINQGKMPLKNYTTLHPSAKVSASELDALKNYVMDLSKKPMEAAVKTVTATTPVALNGIAYFSDYRNWQVITSSNRFDNNTMRIIYGNDIAIKAVQEGNINPWPNGAKIVKVVWNKNPVDANGNVTAGSFNNVQIMIRDDQQYKATDGWGYARFNTKQLTPYGKTAGFATECSNCHRLADATGFVFDVPMQNPAITK